MSNVRLGRFLPTLLLNPIVAEVESTPSEKSEE